MTLLIASEVDLLLEHLCTRLGFCLSPDARLALRSKPPEDLDTFTNAVFSAESLDPETCDRHLYRQVHDSIRKAFQTAENRETL